MTDDPLTRHYTVPQAALMLGVSENTIWRRLKEGVLTRYRVGGRTVIRGNQLAAMVRRADGEDERTATKVPPPEPVTWRELARACGVNLDSRLSVAELMARYEQRHGFPLRREVAEYLAGYKADPDRRRG